MEGTERNCFNNRTHKFSLLSSTAAMAVSACSKDNSFSFPDHRARTKLIDMHACIHAVGIISVCNLMGLPILFSICLITSLCKHTRALKLSQYAWFHRGYTTVRFVWSQYQFLGDVTIPVFGRCLNTSF